MTILFSVNYLMAKAGCREGCYVMTGRSNTEQVTWVQHGHNPEHRWQIKDRDSRSLQDTADQMIAWVKRVHEYGKLGAR